MALPPHLSIIGIDPLVLLVIVVDNSFRKKMLIYEFKSRTALRPYFRTTIAKRRKFVKFEEAQTIYNPDVFTWGVLKSRNSTTLRHLANLKKGFRLKDPYERFRLRIQLERMPIMLNRKTEDWTSLSLVPTSAVEHYKAPKPSFKPPSHSPEGKIQCTCSKRDGLQYNCKKILMTAM